MRTTKNKRLALAVLALAVVAGAVYCASVLIRNSANGVELQEGEPASFHYLTVQPSQVTLTTEMPGRVSALMVSEVRPQVSGIILERLFTEGSDVTAGQILYQIDPAIFEAAFGNAKATLAKAEATEKSARLLARRYSSIVKNSAVSKQEYDDAVAAHQQARADVEAARQALETARINLGYTRIKAPVSGRIGHSLVTPGALVTQHQPEPLAVIQQLNQVYVDVTHSNSEILKLRRALASGKLKGAGTDRDSAPARLRLEDGSMYTRLPAESVEGDKDETQEEIQGDLLFSDVTIEKSTGVVAIRAIFENPDKILLPGMYVRALVEEGRRDDAILVPQRLVMRDQRDRPYVYILTRETPPNAAESENPLAENQFYVAVRLVSIERHYQNQWLLAEGLQPGDRVLAEGLQKAHPGLRVTGLELPVAPAQDTAAEGRGR